MKFILAFIALVVGVWFVFCREPEVRHGPGVVAPNAPEQEMLNDADGFPFKGFTVTPLATFSLTARVLSRERYSDEGAVLAPVDLALGWGRMSDETILDQITIRQHGRFYKWDVKEFPIPQREIETHSANMHLIPASDTVEAAIKSTRKGDIVTLRGSLVRVAGAKGWHWRSSLERTDTGRGACELIFVEYFSVR